MQHKKMKFNKILLNMSYMDVNDAAIPRDTDVIKFPKEIMAIKKNSTYKYRFFYISKLLKTNETAQN